VMSFPRSTSAFTSCQANVVTWRGEACRASVWRWRCPSTRLRLHPHRRKPGMNRTSSTQRFSPHANQHRHQHPDLRPEDCKSSLGSHFARCRGQGPNNMPDLHTLPQGWEPLKAIRNNGPDNLALERYKLRELAEGWPMYRSVTSPSPFPSPPPPPPHALTPPQAMHASGPTSLPSSTHPHISTRPGRAAHTISTSSPRPNAAWTRGRSSCTAATGSARISRPT
jgi:hypothetical protein